MYKRSPLLVLALATTLVASDKPGFPFSLWPAYKEKIPLSTDGVDKAGSVRSTTTDWIIAPPSQKKPENISLIYTAGESGITTGGGLKLMLGQVLPTEQQIYTPFSLTVTSAYFFGINLLKDVEVTCSNPEVQLRVEPPRPGASFDQILQYVRYKRGEGADTRDSLLRQIDNEYAVRILVTGGQLRAGDSISVTLGATKGLEAPKSEASWQIITRVDGDGNGTYGLLADAPSVDAWSADTTRVVLRAPSSLHVGDRSTLALHTEDSYFLPNLTRFDKASIRLKAQPGLEFPTELEWTGDRTSWEQSVAELPITATREGLYYLVGEATVDGKTFPILSNPIEVVPDDQPKIYFGDLHIHSLLSYDADRPPEYVWWRQRFQERLDFAALSDHDMIGAVPFAKRDGIAGRTPDEWEYAKKLANSKNEPGKFVSILAYEWTSYYFGHRNIFFSGEEADPPLFHHNQRSEYPPYDEERPGALRDRLAGHRYIAIPHSTAWPTKSKLFHWGPEDGTEKRFGTPEAWPEQRQLELYSTHGTSEYFDNEYAVDKGHPEAPTNSELVRNLLNYNIQQAAPDSGNFAQDALANGWEFGFIGSSDDHYLSHLDQAYKYGLAAVFAEDLTRQDIWDALNNRQSYAVTGERILMHFYADGAPMGSTVAADGSLHFTGLVAGTGMLESLELVRWDGQSWGLAWSAAPRDEMRVKLDYTEANPKAGNIYYLRIRQQDGNRAWSSPVWVK